MTKNGCKEEKKTIMLKIDCYRLKISINWKVPLLKRMKTVQKLKVELLLIHKCSRNRNAS